MDSKDSIDDSSLQNQFVSKVMNQVRMYYTLKYCKKDNIPAEVLPRLYIGSIGAAMNKPLLLDLGITHILCIADDIKPMHPEDFVYKTIAIPDSPDINLKTFLPQCFEFINSSRESGKILIHCFAGKSRSASVVIAYLIRLEGWEYSRAYEYLKGKRNTIEPNIGFAMQLSEL